MRTFAQLLIASIMLVSPAAARDVYVSNVTGMDTFTGRFPRNMPDGSGPVHSIAKALRIARQGDRIVLENTGQPYRESVTLAGSRHSGHFFARSPQPFVIEGSGAVLDGSAAVEPEAWEHYNGAVFRFRPPHLGHQQLFLNHQPALRVAVGRPSDFPPKLGQLEWCLHGGHIYFCVEPTRLPRDYPLTYAEKRVGITLFHVQGVEIRNLTIEGFQLDGINAYNSARHVSIISVTCGGNGRSGMCVGGASLVDIENCLLAFNGRAQLLTLPYSQTHVRGSQLLAQTAPGWVDRGGRVYIDGEPVEDGMEELGGETAAETPPPAAAAPVGNRESP